VYVHAREGGLACLQWCRFEGMLGRFSVFAVVPCVCVCGCFGCKQPMTLQRFVYMACTFASISALPAYLIPSYGARYGFFATTPHLKLAAFCICVAEMGVFLVSFSFEYSWVILE